MNNPNYIILTLVITFFTSNVYAQPADWEVGMFLGFSAYQGDVATKKLNIQESNPAIGFTARYKYYYTLNFRANLLVGRLDGDDKNSPARASRGYSFQTTLIEVSGMAEWEPFGKLRELKGSKNNLKISPYLLGGIGFSFTNPKPFFPDLGSVGSMTLVQQDLRGNYSNIHFTIPVAVGARYDVSRQWMIGAEIGPRFPFTDYLDGISKSANPDAGDWYWFFGLTAMYNLR